MPALVRAGTRAQRARAFGAVAAAAAFDNGRALISVGANSQAHALPADWLFLYYHLTFNRFGSQVARLSHVRGEQRCRERESLGFFECIATGREGEPNSSAETDEWS